ncbi:hypothetical protein BAUCODRAFT_156531 [Baudoinia panamericana UAMH 10762]|uniref:Uncharacterized protein n=1 Tax=Baudoinia panamericana (strain UAMH 10762) TaxID=717646 RepID=M2MI57_BAUPA|nr:uncharacterized protein BAUCODRAFT_156531 [Baudoinia panamericana UAMH 10762]EMC96346.1 hypothetical protein BAUCODRAFT_156531 [Baudoinia panamericana UAMH 10762]
MHATAAHATHYRRPRRPPKRSDGRTLETPSLPTRRSKNMQRLMPGAAETCSASYQDEQKRACSRPHPAAAAVGAGAVFFTHYNLYIMLSEPSQPTPLIPSHPVLSNTSLSKASKNIARPAMQIQRGMWVWNTAQLLTNTSQIDSLVATAGNISITDLYLYVAPTWWDDKGSDIAGFNSRLNAAGVRMWALDGDAAYIDDATAQGNYLSGLHDLVQFNQQVDADARFFGFQADIEPQDTAAHETYFYNGIVESDLTPNQTNSRDTLLLQWLDIFNQSSTLLRGNGLQFGAALPFWLDNYDGEPLTVPTTDGNRTGIMDLIMPVVDEYVIMSYNTHPESVVSFVQAQAAYASEHSQQGERMPRVLGGVETEQGVGAGVSYGDTPGKQSRTVVLSDIAEIEANLTVFPSFGGMAIHHWSAWEALGP